MGGRGVNRVVVVGSSGSGKTTMAKRLAHHLGCEAIELDSIHHRSDWTPIEDGAFSAALEARIATPRWVIDGNYPQVADIAWDRADTIVWLDLPRWLVMKRITFRSLRRLITREELWNGNQEKLAHFFSSDPDRNLFLWTWTHHASYRTRYEQRSTDPRWRHLEVIRLGSPAAVRDFVGGIATRSNPHPG